MKKLLLALALLLVPASTIAQCNGRFTANQLCGTVPGGLPGPIPFSAVVSSSGQRVKLTTATTFYVSTIGTNTSTCGVASGVAACRTRGYLYNLLQANYDLGGQIATVQIADGTYTDSFQANGPIVGQVGASGLIFQGNCAAGATNNVLIQPAAAAGYAYSAAFSAEYSIYCQKLDMTTQVRAGPASGADTVALGQGGRINIGNPALFNVRPDVWFGCNINGFNQITVAFSSFLQINNDITVDPGICQVVTTGNVTSGSGTIASVATTTNIVQYMGIQGTGLPNDAYVNSTTASTIVLGCIFTSPCVASATNTGVTLTASGGGQTFLDMGNGGQVYFNTNGQPDYSIFITLGNYPFFTAGFFFINELSAVNAQAITFINPGQARGQCSAIRQLSNIDTGLQGLPYIPCNSGGPEVEKTPALTAGLNTFTVGAATGIVPGMVVTDVLATTGTWTAGANTMVVASATALAAGAKVTGLGILSGAVVTNVSGTTITIGGCGAGPKCVTGSPLYISETASPIWFSNSHMSGASVVTGVSGTTITISDTIVSSSAGVHAWFQSRVSGNSIYN